MTLSTKPELGQLVEVRGRRWVVTEVDPEASTLVELQSVEDGRYGETLSVIWEVEPGSRVLPAGSLPEVTGEFDAPEQLVAFLDAIRWGAVTSADVTMLQAPFRSGVSIENYQLEPVARALTAPRVNLLLADDVGLGKTIEAGLVMQELLLRHRARRAMIICPAGLTMKWRDEMADRFGLDFVIVNAEQCATLRRTHGSAANPFRVYPFIIVSLPWLRSPRAQRLLDEVLPREVEADKRVFDLLILDEAHHVAPAAPKQRYAVDSQQTKLLRRLAPHFEHRLFLSATPHNGYPESFTALLELVDDQRFARGVDPDPVAQREVVVRRLKRDVRNSDGTARFLERVTSPIVVEYPDHERGVHATLRRFAEVRAARAGGGGRHRRSVDLMTLLLKKRLFSSPQAFLHTVQVYRDTLSHGAPKAPNDQTWMDDFFLDLDDLDDEDAATQEDTAVRRVGAQPEPRQDELDLLATMQAWASQHTANPDAKASALIIYLRAVCRPDGTLWTNERVVVFTEYRDTQLWLQQLLRQEGFAADRVALLHGGLDPDEREGLRQAFQAEPSAHPVRILLATDAASEGIDLHWHCHRLVNYDIPFNPNKLEQRIGRIDRYGQKDQPEVRHFVGVGWQKAAPGSYEADLEFLSRVAQKVAQMEEDLGAVNAVLADTVQRRMLGQPVDIDEALAAKQRQQRRGRIASDSDVRGQVARLRQALDTTVREVHLTPTAIEHVVATALALARQQPLQPAYDIDEGVFEVPALTGSWARATEGLVHPLHPDEQRPVTFDATVAERRREDVVLAHLNHPLVAMSTQLLRAAANSSESPLNRVAAVVSDDPALESTLVVSYARFVIVGGDGIRLHEEVLHAGGWMRDGGRFARVENLGLLDAVLTHALDKNVAVAPHVRTQLVDAWPKAKDGLVGALQWRAADRRSSLEAKLDKRKEDEQRRVTANLERFENALQARIRESEDTETEVGQLMLDLTDEDEKAQLRRDQSAWRQRLERLAVERDAEISRISARYASPQSHLFPVCIVFVVPRREVVR